MIRRSALGALMIGIVSFVLPPAVAGQLTPREVASKIQKFYDQTTDFQAAFRQVYHAETLGKDKTSSGYVYIKKPGRMRWDYKEPRPKYFVADGHALYAYDPELEQVMVDRSFSDSDLSAAVTFLWGKGNLTEEFQITFSKRTDLAGPKQVALELQPKKDAHFTKLIFVVDTESFMVDETLVEDPGGNINQISFTKAKTNVGLKDEIFKFEIPKGVTVIEAPKNTDK
jgi:outer membrane lipoprotein carrier protein